MDKISKKDIKITIKALKELKLATDKMLAGAKTSKLWFMALAIENLQKVIGQYENDFKTYLKEVR